MNRTKSTKSKIEITKVMKIHMYRNVFEYPSVFFLIPTMEFDDHGTQRELTFLPAITEMELKNHKRFIPT